MHASSGSIFSPTCTGINRPVFIVGCSRSGTTMLQSILSQHNELVGFPETNVLNKVLEDLEYRRFGRSVVSHRRLPRAFLGRCMNRLGVTTVFDWDTLTSVQERLKSLGPGIPSSLIPAGRRFSIRRVFGEFCGIMDYAARGKRWVDKSPQNLYCIHLLHRYIKAANFIHIVREGKANVASLVDAGRKYKMFRSRFGGPDGIDKAINFYNSSLCITKRYGGRKRHVVVRYEDLAEDAQTTLTPVENLLGISIDSNALSYRTEGIITLDEVWKYGCPEIRLRKSKFAQVFSSEEQGYVASRILDVEKWFPRWIHQDV